MVEPPKDRLPPKSAELVAVTNFLDRVPGYATQAGVYAGWRGFENGVIGLWGGQLSKIASREELVGKIGERGMELAQRLPAEMFTEVTTVASLEDATALVLQDIARYAMVEPDIRIAGQLPFFAEALRRMAEGIGSENVENNSGWLEANFDPGDKRNIFMELLWWENRDRAYGAMR